MHNTGNGMSDKTPTIRGHMLRTLKLKGRLLQEGEAPATPLKRKYPRKRKKKDVPQIILKPRGQELD